MIQLPTLQAKVGPIWAFTVCGHVAISKVPKTPCHKHLDPTIYPANFDVLVLFMGSGALQAFRWTVAILNFLLFVWISNTEIFNLLRIFFGLHLSLLQWLWGYTYPGSELPRMVCRVCQTLMYLLLANSANISLDLVCLQWLHLGLRVLWFGLTPNFSALISLSTKESKHTTSVM